MEHGSTHKHVDNTSTNGKILRVPAEAEQQQGHGILERTRKTSAQPDGMTERKRIEETRLAQHPWWERKKKCSHIWGSALVSGEISWDRGQLQGLGGEPISQSVTGRSE